MIFGRGTAQTDEAIIEEYYHYLSLSNHLQSATVLANAYRTPSTMCNLIGKPILAWKNEDILALYQERKRSTQTSYNVFLTFLLFRGYHRADLPFLESLHLDLSRSWAPLHAPYRSKIVQAEKALGHKNALNEENPATGTLLELLICILIVTHQTLDELTRETFEAFREDYQQRYRKTRKDGLPDCRLFRLEQYLVHWNNFPQRALLPNTKRWRSISSTTSSRWLFHSTCGGAMSNMRFQPPTLAEQLSSTFSCGSRNTFQRSIVWMESHAKLVCHSWSTSSSTSNKAFSNNPLHATFTPAFVTFLIL